MKDLSHVPPWPFGLNWLRNALIVFGLKTVPEPPQKAPVQIAADSLIKTQRDLLDAKSTLEEAEAVVQMLVKREARLLREIQALSRDTQT